MWWESSERHFPSGGKDIVTVVGTARIAALVPSPATHKPGLPATPCS